MIVAVNEVSAGVAVNEVSVGVAVNEVSVGVAVKGRCTSVAVDIGLVWLVGNKGSVQLTTN